MGLGSLRSTLGRLLAVQGLMDQRRWETFLALLCRDKGIDRLAMVAWPHRAPTSVEVKQDSDGSTLNSWACPCGLVLPLSSKGHGLPFSTLHGAFVVNYRPTTVRTTDDGLTTMRSLNKALGFWVLNFILSDLYFFFQIYASHINDRYNF